MSDSVLNGNFQITFVGRIYDGTNTTFTYQVCKLKESPDLSHWVLAVPCDTELLFVDATHPYELGCDPTTQLDGVSFTGAVPYCCDGSNNNSLISAPMGLSQCSSDNCNLCSTTDCPSAAAPGGDTFSVTLSGDVALATSPAGVTIATKAGTLADTGPCLPGPGAGCAAPTTTSTTQQSTTTTTAQSSTTTTEQATTTTTGQETTTTTDPGTTTTTGQGTTTTTAQATTTTTPGSTSTTTPTTSTTTTTLQCGSDGDCDDGDACTSDRCSGGTCTHVPVTGLPPETDCNDMLDNDCNGLIDCADPACAGIAPCAPVRRDPSIIKFGPAGRALDLFQAEGRVAMGPIDITRVEVDWLLTNSNGAIYRGALIPGDFVAGSTGRVYRFSDPGARTGNGKRFGIYTAQMKKLRDGTGYSFKVRAYGDLSAATEPNMDFQLYVGDLRPSITSGKLWIRTPWGWRAPRDH